TASALGVILAVVAPLIIGANTVVAVTVLRLIQKSGSKGLYFILNLAVADAAVGFTGMGLVIDEFYHSLNLPQIFCVLRMAFVTSSSAASILSLVLVVCDRHLSIRKPFHYLRLVTGTRVGMCLLGVWLVAVFVGFLPALNPDFQKLSASKKCFFFGVFHPAYMLTIFCIGFLPLLFVFIYLYCDILTVASAHVQRILEVQQAGLAEGCSPPRSTSEVKAMRTVTLLITCFTLSWLPFFIISVLQTACSTCYTYGLVENYLWLPGFFSSLLNPLLYSYRQKAVRLQLSQWVAEVKKRIL
ncbi:GP119 protein, partial [Indicator maculatus]|nr:GP119 protein [Indicator maculatus]